MSFRLTASYPSLYNCATTTITSPIAAQHLASCGLVMDNGYNRLYSPYVPATYEVTRVDAAPVVAPFGPPLSSVYEHDTRRICPWHEMRDCQCMHKLRQDRKAKKKRQAQRIKKHAKQCWREIVMNETGLFAPIVSIVHSYL